MHDRGFKRWVVLGALASASWWVAACGVLPQQAGNESFAPGFVRDPSPTAGGFNGTIKDIPTSIDPRTPQTEGTPGRSLAMDLGERALLQQQGGLGGSGVAGQGPASLQIEPKNDKPAAQSLPGEALKPANPSKNPLIDKPR